MATITLEANVNSDGVLTLKLPRDIPPGPVSITIEPINGEQQQLTEYERRVMEERSKYLELHPTLKDKLLNQYVAIHQGHVVDSDPDRVTIWRRMQIQYPDEPVFITQVLVEPDPLVSFRSTRFAGSEE